jgi:ABC-type transport system involved in multi-copper enzyme maturation permease subunit
MIRGLRAELRKIWTIRSTYMNFILMLGLVVALVGFWIYGYKDAGHAVQEAGALRDYAYGAISVVGIFVGFLAILSVCHEYRYNTILYSLTNVNRRSKLFVNKWVASVLSALVLSAITLALGVGAMYIGQAMNHINEVHQTMLGWDFVWRAAVGITGSVTFGYIIAMLLRSQVAAIAAFLIIPSTLESLLMLVLKDNVKYLPFTALGNVGSTSPSPALSVSLTVVGVYTVVFGLAAWILFMRRDAN